MLKAVGKESVGTGEIEPDAGIQICRGAKSCQGLALSWAISCAENALEQTPARYKMPMLVAWYM